jgi:hypothetical protein
LHFFFFAAAAAGLEPEAESDEPAFGHATATELNRSAVQAVEARIRESMGRL